MSFPVCYLWILNSYFVVVFPCPLFFFFCSAFLHLLPLLHFVRVWFHSCAVLVLCLSPSRACLASWCVWEIDIGAFMFLLLVVFFPCVFLFFSVSFVEGKVGYSYLFFLFVSPLFLVVSSLHCSCSFCTFFLPPQVLLFQLPSLLFCPLRKGDMLYPVLANAMLSCHVLSQWNVPVMM